MAATDPTSFEVRNLVAQVVNHYGDCDHPAATSTNLQYFARPYIRLCIKKAIDSQRLSPLGVQALNAWQTAE